MHDSRIQLLSRDLQQFEADVRQLKALWEIYLSHIRQIEGPPAYASFTRRTLSNLVDLRACERPAFARFTLNGAKGKVEYGLVCADDCGERLEPYASFLFDTHGTVVSEPRLVDSIGRDPVTAQVLHLSLMRDLCELVALGNDYTSPPDRLQSRRFSLQDAFHAIASRIRRRREMQRRLAQRRKARQLRLALPPRAQVKERAWPRTCPRSPRPEHTNAI